MGKDCEARGPGLTNDPRELPLRHQGGWMRTGRLGNLSSMQRKPLSPPGLGHGGWAASSPSPGSAYGQGIMGALPGAESPLRRC